MKNRMYREVVKCVYQVGVNVTPSMVITKMGRKYVTCQSIMDKVHTVKYTYIDFAFNFMNQ